MPPALPKATITRREDITPDLWKIWLSPEIPFKFKPGQYCTIGHNDIERAYSIVSSPYEEQIELFIALVPLPYGNLTPLLYELGVGKKVTIRPRAKGIFTLDEKHSHHLMVATVTGVVPYVSILRSYLHDRRKGHKFYVLEGASYADEFTYDKELQEMVKAHPDFIAYAVDLRELDTVIRHGLLQGDLAHQFIDVNVCWRFLGHATGKRSGG